MARTPSMTADECLVMIGCPRGNLRVDSTNRHLVRKWLTAQGMPSLFVGGLSMTELALAYNQTDGAGLRKLESKLAETIQDVGDTDDIRQIRETSVSDMVAGVAAKVAAHEGNGHALTNGHASEHGSVIENAIRALAASVAPQAPTIDAEAVRAIVREETSGIVPVVRLEIVSADGTRVLPDKRLHAAFKAVFILVSQNIPAMLVGPAGSGKSTIAENVAEALGFAFYMEGALDGAHKVTGYTDGHGHYQTTPFRQAYEHGGIYCWEEADNTDPGAALVFNNALANGHMTFPDCPTPIKRHPDFRMVACANTYGRGADRVYVGRNQLDGATLDRFGVLDIEYDESMERAIAGNIDWVARVQAIRKGVLAEKARMVVSPRASIYGSKLIAAGMDTADVENAVIWKGIDTELRRRIECRVMG